MWRFLAKLAERWADERPADSDDELVESARRVVTMSGRRWDREAERTFRRELARWAV